MKKINQDWHRDQVMPREANLDERVAWHIEHARECGCREIPAKIRKKSKGKRLLSSIGSDHLSVVTAVVGLGVGIKRTDLCRSFIQENLNL